MKELKEVRMGIITVLALMLVSIKRRLSRTRKLSSGITTLTLAGIVLLMTASTPRPHTGLLRRYRNCQVLFWSRLG